MNKTGLTRMAQVNLHRGEQGGGEVFASRNVYDGLAHDDVARIGASMVEAVAEAEPEIADQAPVCRYHNADGELVLELDLGEAASEAKAA